MEDTHNTVVIYSFSIYYNTITLFIREMMDLALFTNYVPALGTQKRPPQAVFFGAQMGPITPRRSLLPPRGRLGEDPQTPSRHRFPVARRSAEDVLLSS